VTPEEERRAFRAAALRALEQFRASLPPAGESELVGEVPWGTWRPDLSAAPGGQARFDPDSRSYLLSAALDTDRVWIKRPFAGCRGGYQVRFRFGPGPSPSRVALAVSFTTSVELSAGEARLLRMSPDERMVVADRVPLEKPIPGGALAVFPRAPHALVFLDDALLFALPESDLLAAEGMQIGVSGGAVRIESVRVKDRTR
jgi:hypothetical protein